MNSDCHINFEDLSEVFFFFLNILSLISFDNRIVTILLNHHKLKLHTTLFSEMLFVFISLLTSSIITRFLLVF